MSLPFASRQFDAASRSARAMKWGGTFSGPNKSIEADLPLLKARSRRAVFNNGYAEAIVESWGSKMIGSGVFPMSNIADPEVKKAVTALWKKSSKQLDITGRLDVPGLQRLALDSTITGGEVLTRFRYLDPDFPVSVPFQVQLLEGDHLDSCPYKKYKKNRVKLGIELDQNDRRVAYHISKEHPLDADYYQAYRRVRVPVRDMIHTYRMRRPGQERGLPWLTSVLIVLYEIDEKETADNVRRKFNSLITMIVEDHEAVAYGNEQQLDEDGNPLEDDDEDFLDDIEPGAQVKLPRGKKAVLSTPAPADPTDDAWLKGQLRKIAAGCGLPVHEISKDLTEVNYSSIRAGLISFRRSCEALLQHFFVTGWCQPVFNRWMDIAVANGLLPIDPADYNQDPEKYRDADWQGPAWEWVDPIKDITATILSIRGGLSSRQKEVRKRGGTTEQIDRENKEDLERALKESLIYDCFGSQTSKNGSFQDLVENILNNNNKENNDED
ncbi:MAG: phage portal protein [Lentisphaeraceae bacterium]|nr:phage portal protein [Lentisphaeraceae bacterium]